MNAFDSHRQSASAPVTPPGSESDAPGVGGDSEATRPLAGRTVLVTRPQPEAAATAAEITALGGRAIVVPALVVEPPADAAPFAAAMGRLEAFDGVILTSANGARAFLARLPAAGARPPVHAVGPKTAAVLARDGYPTLTPLRPGDSATLAQAILAGQAGAEDLGGRSGPESGNDRGGKRFLFPRAETGREELVEILTRAGHHVTRVDAYRARPIDGVAPEVVALLGRGGVDAILFFSGRSAEAFVAALPDGASTPGLRECVIAALSPLTARAVRALGLRVDLTARRPDSGSVVAALADHARGGWPKRLVRGAVENTGVG